MKGLIMQLKGKTAIITGGGSGFGASMADLFAKNGAKVIVADLNLDGALRISEKIGGYAVEVDVSNTKSVEQMEIDVFKKYERVDIVVNNAGVTHLPAMSTTSLARVSGLPVRASIDPTQTIRSHLAAIAPFSI